MEIIINKDKEIENNIISILKKKYNNISQINDIYWYGDNTFREFVIKFEVLNTKYKFKKLIIRHNSVEIIDDTDRMLGEIIFNDIIFKELIEYLFNNITHE